MKQGEKKESSSSSSFSRWITLEGCCFFLDLSVDQVPASERIVIELTMGDTWSSNYASYMVKEGKEKPHVSPAKVFNYGDFICSKRDQGLVDAAADFGQQCGYQSKAYISPQITDGFGFNIVFDHMDFLNCRVPVDGSVLQGNETLYKIQPHHRVVITDCGVIPKYQLNNFLTKPAQVFPFYQIFWSLQHGDHQDSIWDKFYSDSEKLVLAHKDSKWGLCTNPVNSEADEGLKKKNHPESDKGIGFCLSDKGLKKNKYPYYSESDKGLKKNKYPYYSESDKGLKKNKYPYYSESDKGQKISNVKRRQYRFCYDSGEGKKKQKTGEK